MYNVTRNMILNKRMDSLCLLLKLLVIEAHVNELVIKIVALILQ